MKSASLLVWVLVFSSRLPRDTDEGLGSEWKHGSECPNEVKFTAGGRGSLHGSYFVWVMTPKLYFHSTTCQ